ncbi:MAG: AraC family transcriptional regulator N-terminal domain-containing protein [Bosea sp. (in: a-proteobacteria)]
MAANAATTNGALMLTDALQAACKILADHEGDGIVKLGLGEALLLKKSQPTSIEPYLYRPLVCLVLQGAKEVQAGQLSVHCQAGQAIVVSHDLPVLSRITQASDSAQYIAFVLPLDLAILRGFRDQIPEPDKGEENDAALVAHTADPAVLDTVSRLLSLAHDARLAPTLAPILSRELHARILFSPQGAILRRILRRDEPSSYVSRAIASIRASFNQPLSVADLARLVGMSRSSFHAHFKAVTGLGPAQYQKYLRLLEARRLIADTDLSISSVAFEIGYKSPSQFSRDYAQKFGLPPRDDRKI